MKKIKDIKAIRIEIPTDLYDKFDKKLIEDYKNTTSFFKETIIQYVGEKELVDKDLITSLQKRKDILEKELISLASKGDESENRIGYMIQITEALDMIDGRLQIEKSKK